ncbi:hypothetical protein WJX81_008339 [Elliptochloris bilobata]|uniref:Uncharacterized protein n=1 Tax=Elliptochloris bilobata TaxID=381761 RepID=A0AAW1S034_9CHLO
MEVDGLRLRLALNKSVLSTAELIDSFAREPLEDDVKAKRLYKRARDEVLRGDCLHEFAVTEDGAVLAAACHGSNNELYMVSANFQKDPCEAEQRAVVRCTDAAMEAASNAELRAQA